MLKRGVSTTPDEDVLVARRKLAQAVSAARDGFDTTLGRARNLLPGGIVRRAVQRMVKRRAASRKESSREENSSLANESGSTASEMGARSGSRSVPKWVPAAALGGAALGLFLALRRGRK